MHSKCPVAEVCTSEAVAPENEHVRAGVLWRTAQRTFWKGRTDVVQKSREIDVTSDRECVHQFV